jgi:hypothetical protein
MMMGSRIGAYFSEALIVDSWRSVSETLQFVDVLRQLRVRSQLECF